MYKMIVEPFSTEFVDTPADKKVKCLQTLFSSSVWYSEISEGPNSWCYRLS